METTPNLQLPYLIAAQAQKHVTHNEALRTLDAIVQLSVQDKDQTLPPANPADGDCYIVADVPSGDWSGKAGQIAAFQDNAWRFFAPQQGWLAWIAGEAQLYVFDGTGWVVYAGGSVNPAALVGVNATADATNKLAVKSDAVLFSHDDVTPGNGSVQHKLNKAASGKTATFLFQDDWSGRAEIGLAGDDNFHVKVSADGTNWQEAIRVDRTSGGVSIRFFDSQQIIVAYNAVGIVQPPSSGGIMFLSVVDAVYPQNPTASLLAYDVGGSPLLTSMFLGSSIVNQGTATLTGTTTPNNKIGIAVDDSGNFYIENRYLGGAARQFCLTFINSYRSLA